MELRTQLAHVAFALVLVMAAMTWLEPEPECPLAGTSKVRRVLMLDAVQKHPTWVDAHHEGAPAAAGPLAPEQRPESYVM